MFLEAVALLGGLAEPHDGLRVVLRHAFAVAVHRTEVGLRDGIPLIGQRTQNLEGRSVVACLKGSHAVLKRPCHCTAEQGEREHAADNKNVGPLCHCFARLGDKNATPVDAWGASRLAETSGCGN